MENENQIEIPEIKEEIHEVSESEVTVECEALEAELAASRQEIRRLSSIISDRERKDREAADFAELFPSLKPDEIPDFVRDQAEKSKIPLIAAYALYARRQEIEAIRAGESSKRSVENSAGPVAGSAGEADLFTLDQIRAMTPKEVKKHYKTIMKSLNKG